MVSLTQARLKHQLRYDRKTGEFFWRVTRASIQAGMRAGCEWRDGYWRIWIDRKVYSAHRLAWLYVHGRLPISLDHKNRIRSDNRIANLREATNGQNNTNAKTRPSRSGLKGAQWHTQTGRWAASVGRDGKRIFLGLFDTPEAAHAAYCKAAKQLYGEFFHSG